jgi:hypothetical protein
MGVGTAITVVMAGMMLLMVGGIVWSVVSGRLRSGDRTARAHRHRRQA